MKKIVLAAFALALSMGAAHAADAKFDGFYGGLKGTYSNGGVDLGGDAGVGTSLDIDGFGGGAFAGYGKTFGNWYVGGELSADYAKLSGEIAGSDADVTKSHSFGAAVRAGYLVSPNVLGYGLVGVERGKFKANIDGLGEDSANLIGFRAGIGAETFMTKNVSLRTEVSYVNWGGKGDVDGIDELRADVGVAYHF